MSAVIVSFCIFLHVSTLTPFQIRLCHDTYYPLAALLHCYYIHVTASAISVTGRCLKQLYQLVSEEACRLLTWHMSLVCTRLVSVLAGTPWLCAPDTTISQSDLCFPGHLVITILRLPAVWPKTSIFRGNVEHYIFGGKLETEGTLLCFITIPTLDACIRFLVIIIPLVIFTIARLCTDYFGWTQAFSDIKLPRAYIILQQRSLRQKTISLFTVASPVVFRAVRHVWTKL